MNIRTMQGLLAEYRRQMAKDYGWRDHVDEILREMKRVRDANTTNRS